MEVRYLLSEDTSHLGHLSAAWKNYVINIQGESKKSGISKNMAITALKSIR